ncbi:MAG TPA: hypothetical protein VLX61_03220, partial [Anaerolineales bacterium]|nr:hypothetical protein [Anaerolineales bacterium]
ARTIRAKVRSHPHHGPMLHLTSLKKKTKPLDVIYITMKQDCLSIQCTGTCLDWFMAIESTGKQKYRLLTVSCSWGQRI